MTLGLQGSRAWSVQPADRGTMGARRRAETGLGCRPGSILAEFLASSRTPQKAASLARLMTGAARPGRESLRARLELAVWLPLPGRARSRP
jgi:hypothetical protein